MTESDPQIVLGRAIRARRVELGLSQDKFADLVGMHRAYYGALERGKWNLTVQTLVRVAQGLGVSAATLLQEAEL